MADLDGLALALPDTVREITRDGRPEYRTNGKAFAFHRSARKDAVDPDTGDPLDDVLVFYVPDLEVKDLLLADDRRVFFTTPHWNGYAAVLVRIPALALLDRGELEDLVVDAWLARASKQVANAWLERRGEG